MNKPLKTFISYSRENRKAKRKLVERLKIMPPIAIAAWLTTGLAIMKELSQVLGSHLSGIPIMAPSITTAGWRA